MADKKKAKQKAKKQEAKRLRADLEALAARVARLEEAVGVLAAVAEPVVAPTEQSVPVSIEPDAVEKTSEQAD